MAAGAVPGKDGVAVRARFLIVPLGRILNQLERFERSLMLNGLNVWNHLNAQVDQSVVSGTFH